MITHKKKFVVSDILQMKWEMSFGGSPLHSDEQGCRAQCTWKRVGREGSVALGQEWGLWGGGVQPHSVNPAHKSSWGGDQRREARSNTSEEQPQAKEAESFGLNEIFQKPNF